MPKVTVSFNLPDENYDYMQHLNAGKTASIIHDFSNFLRGKTKYGDGKPVDWEVVREEWWKLLNEEQYDPYES